jgi:Na+-transporting methylmalonyl-CoA/oxaloacetate decarboxylase beta subunit
MKAVITNLLVFNAGWLSCVLAGANHLPWLGTVTALLIVVRHLSIAADARKELSLILIAGGIGAVWDSALVYAGILEYPSGTLIEGTAPNWIIAMWLLFATTLNVSLRWLKQRPALAGVLGALSGPTAYFAGHKLGGVQIPDLAVAMLVLGCGWALIMPFLMSVSNRLDGIKVQTSSPALAECNARV